VATATILVRAVRLKVYNLVAVKINPVENGYGD
jgi:hypothetical protein